MVIKKFLPKNVLPEKRSTKNHKKPNRLKKVSINFLLSEEQTLLSKQRTMMSFMRTGLAFISVGIAVLAFVKQIYLNIIGGFLILFGVWLLYRAYTKLANYRERTEKLKKYISDKGYDYYEHIE